jgi:hypothetical protein
MPEVSRFYGIVIKIFYDDHNPPHFHAEYGEHEVLVNINAGSSRWWASRSCAWPGDREGLPPPTGPTGGMGTSKPAPATGEDEPLP